jgi:2-keto-3-deoxy-L-rhamnonate aldolase RhmA
MARPQEGPGQERQKIGIFFDLDGPLAMECIALTGFGYAIVDLEHGPLAVKVRWN